jgi:hypothetical protein
MCYNLAMKKAFIIGLLGIFSTFFIGCGDDASVVKYDKNLHIKCLRLVVFPPNNLISSTLKELYNFSNKCEYELQASQKSGITCNSNQNAPQKTFSNFPSGYFRLDIYKNGKPIYSYYKDLTHKTTKEDIKRGFDRLRDDMFNPQ